MPLYGQLDLANVAERLPRLPDLDTEAWHLPKAEMLQLLIEVPHTTDRLLPKAMHPAVPSYVVFAFTHYPESPVGPFSLAVLRLGSRAGAHPRGFVLGAYASEATAAAALRERWGFPVDTGTVTLRRWHDRITGTVVHDGKTVLDCALLDPEAISGSDVQYINWVTLGHAPLDGSGKPLLIQVDPHYTFHRAERGRPVVRSFDAAAWNAGPVILADPVLATCCIVDTDLPRIRFVMDPEIPVFKGTRRIRESREAG
jgi:hypothetical protein